MAVFRQFCRSVFGGQATAELTLAQWDALRLQVPLMYVMLLTNSIILAATHYAVAPHGLTLIVPGVLTVLCTLRIVIWMRDGKRPVTVEKARRGLRMLVILGPMLAVGFTWWSLSLFPYGDQYQQSHVAFFMGITVIGCMFCLLRVRQAALAISAIVIVPFLLVFGTAGEPTLLAIAVNMLLVTATLTVILFGNYRDFAGLVASRTAIAQKQAETQALLEENHRLAWLDSLTGVPNRRSFHETLGACLEEAGREGRTIALARLNLDAFKAVNEVFGQFMGDQVLREIAQRLDQNKPPHSFFARLDSDNFALIVTENTGSKNLERLGKRLGDIVSQPITLVQGTAHVTASIGFAASSVDDTPETLFDHADYASWLAKRDMRGRWMIFSAIDAHDLRQIRRMEQMLHAADLDSEIYILLQPQFDVSIGETTGYEVLARWRSPHLGEVSPADFIPMAERMGQIGRITQVVLRKAIEVSKTLPRGVRLSVNLSAHDIGSDAAVDEVIALVQAADQPTRIDFEITETAVMRDLHQANEAVSRLLNLGSRIALDDFGTGHSSLTHVQRLPLHRIKIDRSFVAEVTTDSTSRAIVKTMIDLCRNLGMSCVFEGIETEEQLEALVGLGGTVMQGYLFGRPMAPEAALELAARPGDGRKSDRLRQYGTTS
ncbi:EAL domain-containing protein [Devosia sp. BK]|uniref:putative bifunctional diguanylate cyclase/phosphodiesterase n=1 Tax=Devosia sp. BK TaxID=2871706 RepID=UPI00293B7353|nr:EAL domain-containing protein [Devosia sp. BK]MDV3251521.1 EAL domain-containing protein [Devosia sp. BK]